MPRLILFTLCGLFLGLNLPRWAAAENLLIPSALTVSTDEKKEEEENGPAEENGNDKKSATDDKEESKGEAADEETKPSEDTDSDKKEVKEEEKEKPQANNSSSKKPKAFDVERKPLKIEVVLDGTFVARDMEEVALRPEVWTKFKVVEAVEHGTLVKQGDVLVRFEEDKIEEALAVKSLEQRLNELSLLAAEEEFPRLEKSIGLDYKNAQREHNELREDFERFQNTLRPLSEKIAKFNYRSSKESLAMEQEELDQLQQMYEADEITEETEEIVLRRQQFAVEMAELYVEYSKFNHDYTMDVSLPRRDEMLTESLKKSDLTLQRTKMAKSLGLSRERYEMEKKRKSRVRSAETYAKLMGDRSLMVIKSPADGVVYYGQCVDGKWSSITSLQAKLKPFGSVSANTVLMTIVQERPLSILSSVSEKDLPEVKEGLATVVVPTGDDEMELEGKVATVSSFPKSRGKFPIEIDFGDADAPEWLVPGMTCKAKVTTYENKEALLVPSSLVQSDEENEKRKYVMVLDEDEDEPVRRKVKLGHRKGKMVEIVKGLEEGEKIVKEDKDKDKDKKDKD